VNAKVTQAQVWPLWLKISLCLAAFVANVFSAPSAFAAVNSEQEVLDDDSPACTCVCLDTDGAGTGVGDHIVSIAKWALTPMRSLDSIDCQ